MLMANKHSRGPMLLAGDTVAACLGGRRVDAPASKVPRVRTRRLQCGAARVEFQPRRSTPAPGSSARVEVGQVTGGARSRCYDLKMTAVRLTLLDVDNADVRDITAGLPDGSASLEPERLDGAKYGEPATIALALVVAVPVVRALAAWVLKRRRKQKVDIRARVLHADGSEVELTVRVDLSDSESPEASVIQQLVAGLGLESALPRSDSPDENT